MSTQTQHTPGPWYVTMNPYRVGQRSIGGPLRLIAECWPSMYLTEEGVTHKAANDPILALEQQANARLIATAPELLAESKKLVAEFESLVQSEFGGTQACRSLLRHIVPMLKAIKAAEGVEEQ